MLNPAEYDDAPAIGIVNDNRHVAMLHDNFKTFLMFQPTNESSINVPLKVITWSWSGAADTNSGGWYLSSLPSSFSMDHVGHDATEFPSWTNVINGTMNIGFQTNRDMNCK
jgi:hypothetical protein